GVDALGDRRVEQALQIAGLSQIEKMRLETRRLGHPLHLLPTREKYGVCHVVQGRNACGTRYDLPDQLDAFWFQFADQPGKPSNVATRLRKTAHGNEGVGTRHNNNRDGRRGTLGREDCWRTPYEH